MRCGEGYEGIPHYHNNLNPVICNIAMTHYLDHLMRREVKRLEGDQETQFE